MKKKTGYKPHEFETWAELRRGDFKRYKWERAAVLKRGIARERRTLAADESELEELAAAKA